MHGRTIVRCASFALAALLALIVAPSRGADAPYEINVILSLTGPGAFLGRGEQLTFAAAERYVNNTGGINGRPIKFVVQDDQSNPATAVQIATQIIAKRVPVFVGPGFGATCGAVLALVANGPVMYCLANTIHPPKGAFAFSGNPSTKDFTAVGLRYLMAKGVRKLALLTSTDTSGQDGEQVALENLRLPEFRDLQLVANEHFGVADISVTAQLARIKAAGAQAVDAWTTGTPFGTVLRAVAESGWDGIVMTNGANQSRIQMEQYASFLPRDLIICTAPVYAIGQVPAAVRLARATWLDSMHQVGVADPDLTHFSAWDPAIIVVNALRARGTDVTAAQLRDYMENLHDVSLTNGIYDFRRGDQRGIDPRASVVVTWDKGKREFVTISRPGGLPL
jgi:branched-chain amino acid transport system substrate-binding protein